MRVRRHVGWGLVVASVVGASSLALAAPAGREGSAQQEGGVRAVASLDLGRYAGRWYEVARFPNRFQRRCVSGTTADYELLGDGSMRVVNQCLTAKGDSLRAEGRARRTSVARPASQLEVRFAPAVLSFLPMVWADYWVLDLTADYSAALVGTPDRRYLWVLARTPELEEATYQRLAGTARAQGFDVTRLERSAAR